MILSDAQIRENIENGRIGFTPVDQKHYGHDVMNQIGPASLDFRLGNTFKIYRKSKIAMIDPRDPSTVDGMVETVTINDGEFFMLHPRQFVLGVTAEVLRIPDDLVARCEGRSSLGRLGLIIHSTAWFIDPGFTWTITLEITNINEVPIKLYPGMRIGQYAFETVAGEVETHYGVRKWSKYMHQVLPEESRVFHDHEHKDEN